MARHIHIHIATKDAGNWEESKHPRAENGQFGKGSGGGAKPAAKKASGSTLGPQGQAGLKKVQQEQMAAAARKSLGIPEKKKPEFGSASPTRPGAKAADPAKMQSTLATINKRLAAGNLTSASKEELTAKRNRIKIEMEKGKLSKSEPKEGDVGHEELTKYGKYLTKGEKVKGPRGEQVEVIRHTGPEVLTTGGSYHPTKLSRVETPSGRSMTPKEVVAQTNANAGKLSVNMDKIKEGSALYDKSGKKVDEVESIEKRRLGNGWTLNTRAGYQVHVGEGGHNAQGWGTEPPPSSGKINTNTEAGRSLASGLLRQATAKPSGQAPQAAPTDHAAGAKRAQQEAQKATGPAKQDWTQASKYYNMARSEASSENPDKGTIREAEAKARYHEARAQGKPIEMPDY